MSGKCETEAGAQLKREKNRIHESSEETNKQKTLDGGFDTDGAYDGRDEGGAGGGGGGG